MWNSKKVLVAGGSGMIGHYLVDLLLERGCNITIASLDSNVLCPNNVEFVRCDLTDITNCLKVCKGKDYVLNLLGVKGSPLHTASKPATFLVPQIMFSLNLMEASRRCDVEKYLFTSSVGVYSPSEVLYEDDVWKTFPSPNDWFAGWAKRIGELQSKAYKIQYGWEDTKIVRPANVYGRYDNFSKKTSMVIPSLISRATRENPLVVWGNGSARRDFVHALDVARAMVCVMESKETRPVNIGSGCAISIKEVVETILKFVPKIPEVIWDETKPTGDQVRLLDISRLKKLGFEHAVSLESGLSDTIEWYLNNKDILDARYDILEQ